MLNLRLIQKRGYKIFKNLFGFDRKRKIPSYQKSKVKCDLFCLGQIGEFAVFFIQNSSMT